MGEGREQNEAFVTLATNDTYALGCLVLGSSLRRVGTTRQLAVMVTSGVSQSMRQQLGGLFNQVVEVNVLDSSDTCNLELLGRPDLSVTFTKFHCWRLTQYQKCVFMDADTLVVQNVDELFDREELSAAPDAGWPDCFNSGVFVYVPSEQTYRNLLSFAVTGGSFDGGDQGLLNLYFNKWATEDIGKHLPFTFNVVSQAFYSYLPAFKQFYDNIKVVHFIGAVKPWHHAYNTASRTVTQLPGTGHSQQFLQMWWNIFMDSVQPNLDPQLYESERVRSLLSSASSGGAAGHNAFSSSSQHDGACPPSSFPSSHEGPGGGHTDTRGTPSTSYSVLYPYTPPIVDGDGDSSSTSPARDGTRDNHEHAGSGEEAPRVVDVPVVYREYRSVETHYTEEPLTSVNPETPPGDRYHDTIDHAGNTTASNNNHSNNSNSNNNYSNSIYTKEQDSGDRSGDVATHSSGDNAVRTGDKLIRGGKSSPQSEDENKNIKKSGIAGDLANMSLERSGEDGAMRDDRERKLQWEQGQADYMGVDRFDNIKARLDEKIAQPTPSGSGKAPEDQPPPPSE
ncbi:glycogenin-1 isoform X2 [Aplysia californica]|uniref:glycogenin glucosyltransferase n=1 Tax=Aplysia californica TaxID=6500 RepID=A0ABM0K3Y6_APLCA|nr:glycogenin-1 isoform X2 [Aplysia californica]